ncbi:MAG: pantoate--beta-alanine ligase [Agrococcus casei]
MEGVLTTLTRIRELREALDAERAAGKTIALVPTMGALHEGHLALVREAAERADIVVASVFVNPMQFGEASDLEAYPRTLDADVAQLEELGVSLVFAPSVDEMYPDGKSETVVQAGAVGFLYEGRSRPGHFDGVLTVVSKLFHIVHPDVAVFGEKDAQQLFLVKRMVRDLNMPVEIVGVPTEREDSGLALSSRNGRIEPSRKADALVLSQALRAASRSADQGVEAMLSAAQGVVQSDSGVSLDYLAAVDPETFRAIPDNHRGPARVIIAARVGDVRLIDNTMVSVD